MRCTIVGCGDAFGSGGRNTTCFQVTGGEATVLVDCGASALVGMGQAGLCTRDIDAVIVTHLHGDHFGGLPFLLLHEAFEVERTRPLVLAGPPNLEARLQHAMTALFGGWPQWPFALRFIPLEPGATADVVGLAVTPTSVDHGQTPTTAVRVSDGTRVFAYSADTCWTDALYEVARGAGVFVMECFAYDRPQPGHTAWATLRDKLPGLDAERILLTHMSERMLAHLDDVTGVEPAHDGMTVEV